MTISHHPDKSTLMAFGAGAMSEPFAAVVSAHIELCPHCRALGRAMNALGGAFSAEATPEPLSDSTVDVLLARLDDVIPARRLLDAAPADAGDLPGALARIAGAGLDRIDWRRSLLPGVDERVFEFAGASGAHVLRFFRALPGSDMPEHRHAGDELTLVLRGALRDGEAVYRRGDLGDLDDRAIHNPIAGGDEPCICVIVEEGPAIFTGRRRPKGSPTRGIG